MREPRREVIKMFPRSLASQSNTELRNVVKGVQGIRKEVIVESRVFMKLWGGKAGKEMRKKKNGKQIRVESMENFYNLLLIL